MRLLSGTRLGPYEILGALGAGGMGEVYRARDTRLQRDVAIKILPDGVASDPERRARFEREARLLAALNDPRIAAIYGVEEDSATRALALVLELVEGPTLQERLASGPLPIDEALPAAARIAGALEAAHERGVIHRDLKPANVKLTADGGVKVLDFGLAKALNGDAVSDDPATSPTITNRATMPGVILGTAAYMSPEQARGRPADRRGDIWAFGAVIYEMLTGARAFPGQTVSDTIAAVLTRDPDWTRLPRDTPPAVRHLIRRCLDRNPQTRLQSIGEARITLTDPAALVAVASAATVRTRSSWIGYGAVAAAAAALGALLAWSLQTRQAAAPQARKVDLSIDAFDANGAVSPALSPDGQRVLYIASGRLFVRALGNPEVRELPGTAGATYPFWSPDSRQVAYVADGRIWRTSIDRGDPAPVGAAPKDLAGSAQGVWTVSGNMVLVGGDSVGLFSVPASGGEGKDILPLDKTQETDFHEIAELPEGRGLLFTVHRLAHGTDTIALFAAGVRRTVLQTPGEEIHWPVYAAPGFLLYQRESLGIWAIRFSLDTLTTTGAPFAVVPGGTHPSIGSDGTIAYAQPSALPVELVWRSRDGRIETVGTLPAPINRGAHDQPFRLSPDGRHVALCIGPIHPDLWSYDLERHALTRLTTKAGYAMSPMWTPNGRRIFFGAFGGGRVWNVHAIGARESRDADRVTNGDVFTWPADISPDGRWLLYAEGRTPFATLRALTLDQSDAPDPLAASPIRIAHARFSPDGNWIAYTAMDGTRPEVYVRRFPSDQERIPVSTGGGSHPVWARDGRELYFRSGERLMAVGVRRTQAGMEFTTPVTLLDVPREAQFLGAFDVARDGRFLMVRAPVRQRIGILLNWTADLDSLQGSGVRSTNPTTR